MARDATNAADLAPERDDVFARIAGRYDRLCDLFSLGAHRLWKAAMVERLARAEGEVIVDVASGTGDIPARLTRRMALGGRTLWVTDLCPQMLDLARVKLAGQAGDIRFAMADAEGLEAFADASVDVLSISFGMKICARDRVMAEAWRVLRPSGTFLCLEAAQIPVAWVHRLYLAYMDLCLPLIGAIAAGGDSSAYDYLLRGVHAFPDQKAFAAEMTAAGFGEVAWRNLTFGIVALHEGRKPA